MHLEDEPLEAGYASEKVAVTSIKGEAIDIGGHNGKTQLIISVPFINKDISTELNKLALTLYNSPLIEASSSLVVATTEDKTFDDIEGYELYADYEGEFGDMYSVRLQDGPLEGELTKALFIISKDGALFYDEILPDISKSFNADLALSKLAIAQECYTGKGCH
jgi:thiol peroxidase